jgi:hypothetical protein
MTAFETKILPVLKTIKCMADIALFLGLSATSSPAFISGVVSDICAGWGLLIHHHTEQEWAKKAEVFASVFTQDAEETYINGGLPLMQAFLDGVFWGNATQHNPRFSGATIVQATRKAKRIGLESPARLLANELDATKLRLMMFEKGQQRALRTIAAPTVATPVRDRAGRMLGLLTPVAEASNDDVVVGVRKCRRNVVPFDDDEYQEEGENSDGSVYLL